jgi:trehalose/maltose transport system permease protein
VAVDVWKATPFMTLLILAALQILPREIYQAGKIDGASPIRMFLRVTLPLIRPALLVAIIFRGLDAMRVFDVIYVLTGNNLATTTMSVYARQQLVISGCRLRLGGHGSCSDRRAGDRHRVTVGRVVSGVGERR